MFLHKKYLITSFILLLCTSAIAHTINYQLENAPTHEVFSFYLKLGIRHIVPDGLDHILFVIGLCLLSPKLKAILRQATAFTIAHSITLALSMKNMIAAPPAIVEPIIALSIMFVAIENILFNALKPWRVAIVFLFGLIHGLGFASSLNETGLPRNKFLTSILSFNIGVELGQIIVIMAVYALLFLPFGKKPWFKKFIVYPLSALIALIAAFWTFERIMN
jgi:hydrogenase/urease accessory protein HupE